MTSLVEPGRPGRRATVRQRKVEDAPFTNCRLAVAACQLVYAGVRIPDKRRFIRVLRRATGVSEIGPAGGTQGTTAADLIRGLDQLLPWVPVEARLFSDGELLGGLASGSITAGVSVPVYNGLPGRLARWSPRFAGGHQIWLADARHIDETPEVLWFDVLGLPPYRGEWVRYSRIKAHLSQAGGRVFATTIARGAAMSTAIVLARVYAPGATAELPKGTPLYDFDAERMALVPRKPTTERVIAPVDSEVRVLQQPQGPDRPRGRFVHLEGTPRYVRSADVRVTVPAPTDPVDVEAVRAAAYQDGLQAGETRALEQFLRVDEPLYRHVEGEIS